MFGRAKAGPWARYCGRKPDQKPVAARTSSQGEGARRDRSSSTGAPKILLGILDDTSGLSVWHKYFHEIIAVVLLVVTLGAGFAFMPELRRSLPVRIALPLQTWNGILVVPVEINGAMTLDFAVDSGAAYVIVPAGVYSTLKHAGTIQEADLLGQEGLILADGSKGEWNTFTIRSLKIGNIVLQNVNPPAPAGSRETEATQQLLGHGIRNIFGAVSVGIE